MDHIAQFSEKPVKVKSELDIFKYVIETHRQRECIK